MVGFVQPAWAVTADDAASWTPRQAGDQVGVDLSIRFAHSRIVMLINDVAWISGESGCKRRPWIPGSMCVAPIARLPCEEETNTGNAPGILTSRKYLPAKRQLEPERPSCKDVRRSHHRALCDHAFEESLRLRSQGQPDAEFPRPRAHRKRQHPRNAHHGDRQRDRRSIRRLRLGARATDLGPLLIGALPGCKRSSRNYLGASEFCFWSASTCCSTGASSVRRGEADECRRTSEGERPSFCH